MSLNIKNERVHALARTAASRTGQSQTSVIEAALTQFLATLDATDQSPTGRRADVDRILIDFDNRLGTSAAADLSTEDLYDDKGLPA